MTEKQDDINLPISVVERIVRDVLPEGCKIAKDAKLALTRAASVFVLYMTTQANLVATGKNRKTISDRDVMEALQISEFGRFEDDLKEALEQYRLQKSSKKDAKQGTSLDDSNRMEDSENIDVVEAVEAAEMEEDEDEPAS